MGGSQEQQELQALLDRKLAAMLGYEAVEPAVKRRRYEAPEETDDEQEASEDEWHGLSGSDDDFDDAEDLHADAIATSKPSSSTKSSAPTIHFNEPGRSGRSDQVADFKSFMKQRATPALDGTVKKRTREEIAEADEERELKKLDATLAEMIEGLESTRDGHLSSLTPSRKPSAPIQRNTPLPIRRGLQQSRVARAKKDAESDRVSGAVRAKSTGGPALNKREMRMQSGEEAKRKKNSRGIGGVLGRTGKGGSTVKFTTKEIRRVNQEASGKRRR